MKLIFENWRSYLYEGMITLDELPDNIGISIELWPFVSHGYRIFYSPIDDPEKNTDPEVEKEPYGEIFIEQIKNNCNINNLWQVMSVHVDQGGYGPLLYDIAMELATKKGVGLISMRDEGGEGEVSHLAYKVWTHYLKKRTDVTAHQLDDLLNTLTPTEKDNCDQYPGYQLDNQPKYRKVALLADPLSKYYTKQPTTIEMFRDRITFLTKAAETNIASAEEAQIPGEICPGSTDEIKIVFTDGGVLVNGKPIFEYISELGNTKAIAHFASKFSRCYFRAFVDVFRPARNFYVEILVQLIFTVIPGGEETKAAASAYLKKRGDRFIEDLVTTLISPAHMEAQIRVIRLLAKDIAAAPQAIADVLFGPGRGGRSAGEVLLTDFYKKIGLDSFLESSPEEDRERAKELALRHGTKKVNEMQNLFENWRRYLDEVVEFSVQDYRDPESDDAAELRNMKNDF